MTMLVIGGQCSVLAVANIQRAWGRALQLASAHLYIPPHCGWHSHHHELVANLLLSIGSLWCPVRIANNDLWLAGMLATLSRPTGHHNLLREQSTTPHNRGMPTSKVRALHTSKASGDPAGPTGRSPVSSTKKRILGAKGHICAAEAPAGSHTTRTMRRTLNEEEWGER